MSYLEMSLPTDIPWKRLAVSGDMIDEKFGDIKFPPKWRSSVAVFYHEPSDLPPEFCNRQITYLKIITTITNFQWEPSEKDAAVMERIRKHFGDYGVSEELSIGAFKKSYPCYGAMLQVGVYPNTTQNVSLHNYPYIMDFEPKKRELYESVSKSGETISNSSNKVNVGKRNVNTQSQEIRNIDKGYSQTEEGTAGQSFLFGAYSYGGKQGSSNSKYGEWGSVDAEGREITSTNNIDNSREKREAYSYQTNISQLYTMLQSYHIGTNRALFFLQPRPHMQDSPYTFINGLRRLEGIQEFFLIVNRPKEVSGLCVEAHIQEVMIHPSDFYKRTAYWVSSHK